MARILVTGGAGFIGAHLCSRLRHDGHQVTILDNLLSHGGIPYIDPRDRFIHGDISDWSIFSVFSKDSFDCIYHLAAQSAGESAYDDPRYDILTNSLGTYNVCKFALEKEVKSFVYTSTVAVYGNSAASDTKEVAPIKPDSIYGVSKYSGELFCHQLLGSSSTKYSIYRIFNAYGPGENLNYLKKGMVSIFSSFVWRGEPIVVKGSIERYRDFTYINDVVDILRFAPHNPKVHGQVYNLSSGRKTTVDELIKEILKVNDLPESYPVKIQEGTPGDTHGFNANIEKLKRDFSWEPRYDLRSGLEEYFNWINCLPRVSCLKAYHPLIQEEGS